MKLPAELTNMVMIEDRENGKVLLQRRRLSWTGLSFPGGHVEPGESFYDSALREVKEETGLTVRNLHLCGVIHWFDRAKSSRYLVFLYRTPDFSGELLPQTEEGEVFWLPVDELKDREKRALLPLSSHFETYLDVFFQQEKSEAFAAYSSDEADDGELVLYG